MGRDLNLLSKEQIPSRLDIPRTGKLLLAFSGGSDSLCLLYLLSKIAPERTKAVYINHNIRSCDELAREIELNRQNAEKLGVELDIIALERGAVESYAEENQCGIEASCRDLRYGALFEYAKTYRFDYILTAHHREDQVETVLMRMLQHSPFYTFQGIKVRDGIIYRPLLSVPKEEINSIISNSGLNFSVDSTNQDIKYMRNFIRHKLSCHFSEVEKETILSLSLNLQEYISRLEKIPFYSNGHYASIKREKLVSSNPISRENVIFKAASSLNNQFRISRAFLYQVMNIVEAGHGKAETGNLIFIASKSELRIFKRIEDFIVEYTADTKDLGQFSLSHEKIDSKTLLIDTKLITGRAFFRLSKQSDSIKLKEGTKKVRELEKRAHVPYSVVLEDEEGLVAVFLSFFDANDRLSRRFISSFGQAFVIF